MPGQEKGQRNRGGNFQAMITRRTLFIWITAAAVLIAGGMVAGFAATKTLTMAYKDQDGTRFTFKTDGDRFMRYEKDGSWKEMFVKGVNLGATVPGHFPGELPATEEDYLRWFKQIDEMGANVIRIYTVHQPVFYSALVKYNKDKGSDPLYFIQGIWSPEEQLIERQDAYADDIGKQFKDEIKKAVAAVYGDVAVSPKYGASSGSIPRTAKQIFDGLACRNRMGPGNGQKHQRKARRRPGVPRQLFCRNERRLAF